MRAKKVGSAFVVLFFIALTLFSFRNYFFKNQVPLPFNLLAFLYSPWKYESWEGYPHGIPNKPLGFDNLKLFYPYRKFTTDELKNGKVPLWNPYVFSGNVHAATYQSNIFYPLNIVYHILPLADAWSVLILVQPILVGWFMYLFLRSLGQSKVASLFGALGFAFSGWMISLWQEVLVLVHTVLWLPLALYASNLIWEGKHRKRGLFLLVFSLACSILAGFLQMSLYVFATVVAWNLFNMWQRKKYIGTAVKTVVFGISTSIFVSAIQWIPAVEAYFLSSRGVVNARFLFDQFLSPIWYLIAFVVPDFWGNPGAYNYFGPLVYIQERTIYIGIFIFILAVFVYFQKTTKEINFWKVFTIISLSLGFALPTSWIFDFLQVPILSVANPARIFAISTLGMCVLAGYGFDHVYEERSKKLILRIIYGIGIILAALWSIAGYYFIVAKKMDLVGMCLGKTEAFCHPYLYGTVSFRNLLLPTIFLCVAWFACTFLIKRKKLFVGLVFTITIMSSLYFANKMLYFSDRKFEYPAVEPITELQKIAGHDRVWSYGNGYMIRNMLSYYRLQSPEGYDALYSQRYGELVYTLKTKGTVTDQINRTDVTLGEAGQFEIMTDNPWRLRLMSLLGVKYTVEHKEDDAVSAVEPTKRFPPDLFSIAWENNNWRIWEYKKSLPRAFVAHNVIIEKDPQRILDHIYNSDINLKNTVILEKSVQSQKMKTETSDVRITNYESDNIQLDVVSGAPGVLVLTDTYYPGWKATVDGKPVEILRADYTFRGIQVEAGHHTVIFEYDPIFFKIGYIAAIIGLICLLLIILIL